jgi:uncharacterized protein YqgC (DUF456 family)
MSSFLPIVLDIVATALIALGLAGAIVPAVPGIPLIFIGIWLIAGVDHYRHVGYGWLIGIATVGAVGVSIDLLAGVLGVKRVGASKLAVLGALLGTIIGLFLGLPGLLLGPFAGAVIGELVAGGSIQRSANVGLGAWLGLMFGTILKLAASLMMLALFAAAWWWNRIR